jgi:UDP-glucose 4-epimerase
MHILITGGAGFIGSNLTEYHLAKGDKVHVVDDLSTGSQDNISEFMDNKNFRFDHADILVWPGLEKAAAWADRIYHLAAVVGVFKVLEEPIKTMATNVAGCERVLRACVSGNWNPQVIIASTSEIYGTGMHCQRMVQGGTACSAASSEIPPFHEDMEPMVGSSAVSRWNYSISKLVDEAFGLSYARSHGLNVIVIRFFNTVGPRQTGRYGMVVPRFVRQAVSGEPLTVYGDGTQRRCFCDVRDTVAAVDVLASSPLSKGEIVNVGNEQEISILNLAERVRDLAGSKSEIRFIPRKEAYAEDFQETVRRRPCLKKFNRMTNFKHAWTLDKTLLDLIQKERFRISKEKQVG